MTSSLSPGLLDLVQHTLLSEVVDELAIGLIVYDEDGKYLAANLAACRLTGYARHELLALPFGSLSDEEGHRRAEETARRGHGRGTGSLRRANGTMLEIEWLAVATRVANLPAMAALFWAAEAAG